MKTSVYQAAGFFLLSELDSSGLRPYLAAAVNIAKGDALHDDGNGKATNATTAFAATFLGIAAEPCDNSSDASLTVRVIPPLPQYSFCVPVKQNAVISQTAVGTIVDLEEVNNIDINDTSIAAGPGFFIDAIDISTEAIAANTYGYAIGHFAYVS